MRIVSQDKMRNVTFENKDLDIMSWGREKIRCEIGWLTNADVFIILGAYSTKEIALKVIEMIWQPRYWVSSNALIKDGDFVPGFERYVFYMPKDEDVK